jgi:hypothetical protein
MVTEQSSRWDGTGPVEMLTLSDVVPSMEALEQRLEFVLLHDLVDEQIIDASHIKTSPDGCGCLGTLCQCDGQDCLGICETHCLIHYV